MFDWCVREWVSEWHRWQKGASATEQVIRKKNENQISESERKWNHTKKKSFIIWMHGFHCQIMHAFITKMARYIGNSERINICGNRNSERKFGNSTISYAYRKATKIRCVYIERRKKSLFHLFGLLLCFMQIKRFWNMNWKSVLLKQNEAKIRAKAISPPPKINRPHWRRHQRHFGFFFIGNCHAVNRLATFLRAVDAELSVLFILISVAPYSFVQR